MAYLIKPIDVPIVYVDDADLAAYLAAGWTQANATQIAAYHVVDPYAGKQNAPPAPKLSGGKAPQVSTILNHVR